MPTGPYTPGTTPQGSEPQNDGTDDNNPNPSGAPQKLIAGKFRSMEEAVEQGYAGLEQGYHRLSEQVGALTRVMETALSGGAADQGYGRGTPPPGGVPVGSAGGPDPYGRYQNPDDIDAASFLTNPNAVLKQREQRLLSQVGDLVGNVVSNAMAVNEFKARNRDLIPHERVVQSFMRDIDPRQYPTIADRLERAGQLAREYLTTVRAGQSGVPNMVPVGDSYVEPPRGGQAPMPYNPGASNAPGTNPQQPMQGQVDPEEKELMDYIAERNAQLQANFGINVK